ncbi:hypothetical protein Glove_37g69 [Diversispora epigaea]|uniref:Uncharacterized protein n=1 Tax=Diversispora epigaea TaxID=1348612 RepID=A0A397JMT9_9GLOM|nr:hypothetical protein Glove_37g69 [Diversispora epigaea]
MSKNSNARNSVLGGDLLNRIDKSRILCTILELKRVMTILDHAEGDSKRKMEDETGHPAQHNTNLLANQIFSIVIGFLVTCAAQATIVKESSLGCCYLRSFLARCTSEGCRFSLDSWDGLCNKKKRKEKLWE